MSAKGTEFEGDFADGLGGNAVRVRFDQWVLNPGDNLSKKIDPGLEKVRLLVLRMSANAFGSDGTPWDARPFRWCNPPIKRAPLRSPAPRRRGPRDAG